MKIGKEHYGMNGRAQRAVCTLLLLVAAVATNAQPAAFNANGSTKSVFSVANGKQVRFAKGNMQYNAAGGTHATAEGTTAQGIWRFAERQYEAIGDANEYLSSAYAGWIDLFGWGTSGWNSGAAAYQPWASHTSNAAYYPGGSSGNDLTGDYANADWARYNAISNGGKRAGLWRVLTAAEWYYLLDQRSASTLSGTADARFAKGSVAGVHGVILFPDAYVHPTGVALPVGINAPGSEGWNGNAYTAEEWEEMEQAGCVFLPTTGSRMGTTVQEVATAAGYWSSTHLSGTMAAYISATATGCNSHGSGQRLSGYAVRPVLDVHGSAECLTVVNNASAAARETYTWNGVEYTASGYYTDTLTAASGCDSVVTLHLTIVAAPFAANGASREYFSVDSNHAVSFSRGNLQYNAGLGIHATADGGTAQGTWRFATHQYDTLGADNEAIGATNDGWIDLFGWGTSGWNSGATAYQPWSLSTDYADYYPGGTAEGNLTDSLQFADWAFYNAIANGGDTPGEWRTMTGAEWEYLFGTRSASTVGGVANARYAKAEVGGVYGVVIFPDVFIMPAGIATPVGINSTGDEGWTGNRYDLADWALLEDMGCIFLPASGYRYGRAAYDMNKLGHYWSATHGDSFNALYARFTREEFAPQGNIFGRNYGQALRAVRDTCVPTHTSLSDTACDSYTWTEGDGQTYTASGHYTYRHREADGCTPTDTLHLTIYRSSTGDTVATACDSLAWHDSTYTASPIVPPTYTLTNAGGCDSVVTLHLTVHHSNTGDTNALACSEYTWWSTTYTDSATPTHTYTNAEGCDSVVTLHLTIDTTSTADTTATACDSLTWHGLTYYSTPDTLPTHLATNPAGCTHTVRLHLTVARSNSGDTVATECDQFTWWDSTYTTAPSLAPTHTYTNAEGCDSIVSLHLTLNYHTYDSLTLIAHDSLTWHDSTYYTTGRYPFDTLNATGCDSTIILRLYIIGGNTGEEVRSGCDSLVWKGQTYTQSGSYLFDTLSSTGGDSTVVLTLTINHAQPTDTVARHCDPGFVWENGSGLSYSASGIYTYSHTDTNGCTQVDTLHLTIVYSTEGDTAATACDRFTWWDSTYTATPSTDPKHTMTNAVGCDSTVSLHLTLKVSTTGDTAATACDSLMWHGGLYTASANPVHTYTNAVGCDSVVTLHLTINRSSAGDTIASACDSLAWWGATYRTSGIYTRTLTNAAGCDSTASLHLTIHYPATDSITLAVRDSLHWHGITYHGSGDFRFDTLTIGECDSTVYLHLILVGSRTGEQWITVCDSTEWKGRTYRTDGIYQYDTLCADGGDSTLLLHLTVHHSSHKDEPLSAEDSLTWHGFTYYHSGIYTYDTLNAAGCDSTVYLTLLILSEYHTVWLEVDSTRGIVSPASNNRVHHGHSFTATVISREGYRFAGWSDGRRIVSRSNPFTFTVESDTSLTALFDATVRDSVIVHLRVNDASLGSISPTVGYYTYHYGETIHATATAATGAHFTGWSLSESGTSYTTAELSLPIDTLWLGTTITLTAHFATDSTQGIEQTAGDPTRVYTLGESLYVEGAEGQTVAVYDVNGRIVAHSKAAPQQAVFRMQGSGVYLVRVGQRPAKRVVVVK
ncbi:MAG: T9SS type A sorting domain-containing protein [Bacteroidales bacterium]|nr:T9SS type A sorting domain-containing protein [Bacteroidales bacterium]